MSRELHCHLVSSYMDTHTHNIDEVGSMTETEQWSLDVMMSMHHHEGKKTR